MGEASTDDKLQTQPATTEARSVFLEKAKLAGEACSRGEFILAVELYTDAINLDPQNHVLYGNRSAAFIRTRQFERALEDGRYAVQLQPSWSKAYYRQGVALQCLGRHADALGAFASALAQDDKSPQLLNSLTEAAMKSPLRATLEPIYSQLKGMKLDKSAFVMISVIGQELLSVGHVTAAIDCLEAALKVGTCGLRLRGSVISALSTAYWKLGNLKKAMEYMRQDLETSQSLNDKGGECRAYGNLGGAYYSQRMFKEAVEHQRSQLDIALTIKDRKTAASALSSLGHTHVSMTDYTSAISSHKQSMQIYKELKDRQGEARELGNIGAVHVLLSDYDNAIKYHQEHLKIAVELGDKAEEGRAYSNLGSAFHYKRDFDKAIQFHKQVLDVAKKTKDSFMEARAYAGLGHALRCKGDLDQAVSFHEYQLALAIKLKDRATEGRALSNLGVIFQQRGLYGQALKLHKKHLAICKELEDRAGQGRAYGNMGCAYSACARYEQAIKFHKQELMISKEVNDRSSEACTHGNLAVAYQAIGSLDKSLKHYQQHLVISQEIGDQSNEAIALSNLGNYYSSCGNFTKAIPFYENFLSVARHMRDRVSECKACHNLGFAHYSLGGHLDAVPYYERNIEIAKDLEDRTSLGRAYCNLGLAYSAIGKQEKALECQKEFLTVSQEAMQVQGEFKACGNIGDIYVTLGNTNQGIRFFQEQLQVAKKAQDAALESEAHGALGSAFRTARDFDRALVCFQKELELRRTVHDSVGICKALSNLGSVHSSLQQYNDAFVSYSEELSIANELDDCILQAEACGNLGITKMNTKDYQEALGFFEQQIATLEQVTGALLESGRAYGNLGECYHVLGDHEEAVKFYDKYLAAGQQMESAADQDNAYRGLGNAHRTMGNLQQALVCFEKRLVVAHELTDFHSKGTAYCELGNMHKILGNYEQALACFEQQLSLARECNDAINEGDALCGLGLVNQKMGEYEKALKLHEQETTVAEKQKDLGRRGRASFHLGMTHEILGNYEQAAIYQGQHLNIASQMNDQAAKAQAYSSLGRTHHALANYSQAISYLNKGLAIVEALGRSEDEARIRHRLGLSYLAANQLDASQLHLFRAAELLEKLREEGISSGEYKLSLYELQAATYQVLQRVLVTMGNHEEALAVAERSRTRDFIDLLQERQGSNRSENGISKYLENPLTTPEQITDLVRSQKASVLYYSIAAGHLYSWLITPNKGIVKFHDSLLSDGDHDNEVSVDLDQSSSAAYSHTSTLLDSYITQVRDALGVEPHLNLNRTTSMSESEVEDTWERDSVFSASPLSYMSGDDDDTISVSSLSFGGHSFRSNPRSSFLSARNVRKLNGVRSSNKKLGWSGKPPLRALYELLISPMEDALPASSSFESEDSSLALVLQGDLYLVPFPVLKGSLSKDYLFRRFRLIVVPSLQALASNIKTLMLRKSGLDTSSVTIIGNPKVPTTFGQWESNPSAEHEAKIVAELFNTKPLLGSVATKSEVVRKLPKAECIHFATHVSWKLSSLILSPQNSDDKSITPAGSPERASLDFLGDMSPDEAPALSEFLLTAADILDQKLSAKLVVIGAAHNHSSRNRITSDGVIGLTRSFLSAGAQSLLVALWPVPDLACKLLLKAFYGGLLQGMMASQSLCQAMQVVQGTKQFSHPSNWAGFILVGGDTALTNKEALMSSAISKLLDNPVNCRDALKVLVHLVDKAQQRIRSGQRSSMYTADASINAKVKGAGGWRELLKLLGFRFQKAANGLPDSVFFPTVSSGVADKLADASNHLHALLGLSPTTLQALAKLVNARTVNTALVALFSQVLSCFAQGMNNVQVPLNLKLWRTSGCHELLASLGFDLIGVGKDEVMLRSGKANSRRAVQCTVQALCALTDSENPAEKEDPTFKLSKVHSASTVISNLSLKSASIDSDLDTKSKDVDHSSNDVSNSRGISKGSKTSITSRPVKTEAHPSNESINSAAVAEAERRSFRALSKSQPLLVNRNHPNAVNSYSGFNGHVRSANKQHTTSSVVDHSRNSSVADPSDSDVDSYSDIVGQRAPLNRHTVDVTEDSSVSNGVSPTWVTNSNQKGNVVTFPVQQRRAKENPARSEKQVLTSTPKQSHEPGTNGTRQPISGYLPNASDINGGRVRRGGSLNDEGYPRGRPQGRSVSESQEPVSKNGPFSRPKSIPRQGENGSSDEEETTHARDRRWAKSSTDLRTHRVVSAIDISGNGKVNRTGRLRVSSVDLPVRDGALRSSSQSTAPLRNGEFKTNHADQLAAEMQQGRKESLEGRRQSLQKFHDDSQSSQDSTDYESRQTKAEWAAAALMNNHMTREPTQPLANKKTSPQSLEMKDIGAEKRRLRREHLANLAHLHSSSC